MDNTSYKLQMGEFNGNSLTYLNKNSIKSQTGDIFIELIKYDLTVNLINTVGETSLTPSLKNSNTNKLDIRAQLGEVEVQ